MREVVIVLENIRSLYNVGSFFRIADGSGVKQIICCGYTGTPDHHRLAKTAIGAEKTVDWRSYEDIMFPLNGLREQGYELVAVEKNDTSTLFTEAEYSDKVALIFGHELDGVSEPVLEMSDQVVHIPMRGHKESLNVSVAGGIVTYHVLQ